MRAQLAAMAEPVRLVAGHDLYREADDADSFFILQEGAHKLSKGLIRWNCWDWGRLNR